MTTRRVMLVVAVMASSLVVGTGAPAAAAPVEFQRYVALGDSYTAGPGIPWPRLDRLGCVVSTNNYPAWVAENLGIRSYKDMSCSAAETTNMTAPQPPLIPLGGPNPPQFNALRPDTDLVTIGIGGNDFGVFGDLTGVCPELASQDPAGAPCKAQYTVDGVDTMKEKVAQTGIRVQAVLRGVHERSPKATVVLVGYPRIAPPTGTCPTIMPFADGDLRWLDDVEQALNTALAKAAAEDGATTFVDMYPASLGHDACAPNPWIQGKDTNLFAAIKYHPFKAGMVGVANAVTEKLTGRKNSTPDRPMPSSVDRSVIGDASTVTLLTTAGYRG